MSQFRHVKRDRLRHGKYSATLFNDGWRVYKQASGHRLELVAERLTRSAAILLMEKGI